MMPKYKPPCVRNGAGQGVAAPGPISRQYKYRKLNGTQIPKPALLRNEYQPPDDRPTRRMFVGIPSISKSGTR